MSTEVKHNNLKNKPAFNAMVPTTRTIPTLLRRGPYTGRLYQEMLEKILNNDRHDVILLDAENHHLYRILHADWISDDKYARNFSKVLKDNGLALDNKGNLIKLSTPIESSKKEEVKTDDAKIEGQEVNAEETNTEISNTPESADEQSPADVNTEIVNQPAGNQNKNYQNGKKNR